MGSGVRGTVCEGESGVSRRPSSRRCTLWRIRFLEYCESYYGLAADHPIRAAFVSIGSDSLEIP